MRREIGESAKASLDDAFFSNFMKINVTFEQISRMMFFCFYNLILEKICRMADDFSNTPFWGNDEQSNTPNQPSSTPWGTVWGKKNGA